MCYYWFVQRCILIRYISSLLSYIFLSMKQALEIVAFAKQCHSFDTLLELE